MYSWEGKITEEPEMVLIVKTKKECFEKIEKIVKDSIDYTNCIAEITVEKQRKEFLDWLEKETK
jgi:periplasmic divalent cation tolerance protein